MWTVPSRLLPGEGVTVVACYDGCAPMLMQCRGGKWYGCDCFGKVTHAVETEPTWWTHLPWRQPVTRK